MSKILEGLNKEQKQAVEHGEGPLLIIAGAGTGKTTVITRRIAWLIEQGKAKPEEILALTFTDKAAQEMQERVDMLVPYGYTDIWISTFHAFGDKLLRENSLLAGLNPDFKVLNRPEAAVFFREHLFEFNLSYYRPLSDPTRFIEALISLFSRVKDEDVTPQEYLAYARDLSEKAKANPEDAALQEEAIQQMEVAEAFAKYQELLAREGLLDFANQFYLALSLLRQHPLILKRYREQFKYILVDEFQDTNFAQYQLAKILVGEHQNITVTGDDDQSIYRFRGAAYSNLLNFINDFPDVEKISINRNYRSHQDILDCAYRLIQNNNPDRFEVKAGINKKLVHKDGKGQAPRHIHSDTISTESDTVARMVKEKVLSGDYAWGDFAILVRSNSDSQSFLQALNMQEIPWQFSGAQGLYAREEVKICINMLRLIANPNDSMSLYYVASSEVYGMVLTELSSLSHYAKRRNKPLFGVFRESESLPEFREFDEKTREKIRLILSDIEKFMAQARRETTGRVLYSFLTDTGYLKSLTRDTDLEKETKIQNLARFFTIVRDFELVAKEDKAMNFVNYLDLLIEAGDDPSTVQSDFETDVVNVLTIHKAKGLEFRIVFLVGLVQGRFPWPKRRHQIELPDALLKQMLPSGDFHIQEERRLFYVGMTRAKEELYLTSASDYGGKRLRKISQFVSEALGSEIKPEDKKKASAIEAIERFAPAQETEKVASPARPKAKTLTLSYYHIDDYLTCPLKYKYVNILRVPIMEHHTVIYGRAMHDAVSTYLRHRTSGLFCEKSDMLRFFEENFDPQGFIDQKHQEERLRVGKEALLRFYEEEQRRPHEPVHIEKDFNFMFEENRINGRFDRVDKREDGFVIMDYKTSEIKTQKEADKRVKESLQLRLYAFAYVQIFNELPAATELYFLESGITGKTKVKKDDFEEVKEKIRLVASGILSQNFEAKPQFMACRYCAYNQICPFAAVK